ncbi:MAG: class I SAM-dependent methyltransferase [PVC group bacterium]|nr:class I SAM-dependent methyltransferase [PVC group bacterium]
MPNKQLIENNKIFQQRQELFKKFGYDINQERKFIIGKSNPITGNILEIGTGKGHFTLELARQGYNFTSIDVSEENQELAKLNMEYFGLAEQVNFRIENAEVLSFSGASFDTIVSVNTIHHVDNPYKVVAEMIRVISSKGKVILSDFNKEGFAIMDKIHQSEGRQHRVSFITLSDLKDYFKRRGFWIKEYKSKNQDVVIANRD